MLLATRLHPKLPPLDPKCRANTAASSTFVQIDLIERWKGVHRVSTSEPPLFLRYGNCRHGDVRQFRIVPTLGS